MEQFILAIDQGTTTTTGLLVNSEGYRVLRYDEAATRWLDVERYQEVRAPRELFDEVTGAVFGDLRAALYDCPSRPFLRNYILGLGGRTYKTSDFCGAMRESVEAG